MVRELLLFQMKLFIRENSKKINMGVLWIIMTKIQKK